MGVNLLHWQILFSVIILLECRVNGGYRGKRRDGVQYNGAIKPKRHEFTRRQANGRVVVK